MDMKDTITLYEIAAIKGKYLTVTEVAKHFSVHPDTIRRWTRIGHLKCLRHPVNNYRIYLLKSLMEFSKNGEFN